MIIVNHIKYYVFNICKRNMIIIRQDKFEGINL